MRINTPTPIAPVKSVKQRKPSSKGGGFAENVDDTSTSTPTQSAQQAAPLASIDSMLFIQSVDADAQQRHVHVKQAGDVLDALEQVRRGILLGAIPIARLQQLSKQLQSSLEQSLDPALTDIMTDIVLRARVELAKAGIYK